MNFLASFLNKLQQLNCVPLPCSKLEVNFLEDFLNITFPSIYKEFLYCMGKGAGNFMLGSYVFYNDIIKLKQGGYDFIVENKLPNLDESAFVFWIHQGYQIAYFKLDEGDNPPIYFMSENENQEIVNYKFESLIDFLESELEAYL